MMPLHKTQTRRRAFTIIEMLIAIAIVLAALGMITHLFNNTSEIVALSMNTSQVINNARTISEQFDEDLANMVGPSAGGILVIVNHEVGDWDRDGVMRLGDANGSNSVEVNENEGVPMLDHPLPAEGVFKEGTKLKFSPVRRGVRSDQLMFIRSPSDGDLVMRSITPATLSDGLSGVPNATFTVGATYARVWYGHAQRVLPDGADPNATLGTGDITSGDLALNRFGTNWILGRQALMLIPNDAPPDPSIWNTTIHVSSLNHNAVLQGISGVVPSQFNTLYKGTTDLANVALASVVGGPVSLSGPGGGPLLPPDEAAADYKVKVYNMLFVNERMRVNPAPKTSALNNYLIAQTHPFLAGNVSDFVVEFAADLNADGLIDRDQFGNVLWYSHHGGWDSGYALGEARFTTRGPSAGPWGATYPNPIYDTSLTLTDLPPYVDGAFMWRANRRDPSDNLAQAFWPYMVRLRFRLHDAKGRINGETDPRDLPNDLFDNGTGRWFEVIARVPRS